MGKLVNIYFNIYLVFFIKTSVKSLHYLLMPEHLVIKQSFGNSLPPATLYFLCTESLFHFLVLVDFFLIIVEAYFFNSISLPHALFICFFVV